MDRGSGLDRTIVGSAYEEYLADIDGHGWWWTVAGEGGGSEGYMEVGWESEEESAKELSIVSLP